MRGGVGRSRWQRRGWWHAGGWSGWTLTKCSWEQDAGRRQEVLPEEAFKLLTIRGIFTGEGCEQLAGLKSNGLWTADVTRLIPARFSESGLEIRIICRCLEGLAPALEGTVAPALGSGCSSDHLS